MLKMSLSWLFPAAICSVAAFQVHGANSSVAEAKRGEVKVSAFGFHRSNSTRFIQQALDSGAKRVVLDRQEGPWVSGPLSVRSGTELIFEEGVELRARRGAFKRKRVSFLTLDKVTNVVLRALGKGAAIRMGAECKCPKSGHQHGVNISSSCDVTVSNLTIAGMGGDGLYLGTDRRTPLPNRNVTISDCVLDDNHRQGISVISVDTLLIERTVMKNTRGASPMAGIDIEPNSPGELLRNIVLRDCIAENNGGLGFQLYPGQLSSASEPITITMENCRSSGNASGAFVAQFDPSRRMNGLPRGGFMIVRNCRFSGGKEAAVRIINKSLGVMDMRFENCVLDNDSADTAVVRLDTLSIEQGPTDGVVFDMVEVRACSGVPWISSVKTPWTDKAVTDVSGHVKLRIGGKTERVNMDDGWRERVFGGNRGSSRLEIRPFDPADVGRIVDSEPGKMVPLTPLKLRFSAEAVVYAAKPGKVTFSAHMYRVNNRPFPKSGIAVTDMQNGEISVLPLPGEKDEVMSFNVPKAGFYRIAAVVKPHALVFTGCDSPLGVVPPKLGLNVFMGHRGTVAVHKSEGDVFFFSRGGDSAFLCGGNRKETLSAVLFDADGAQAAEWRNIGEWGFCSLAGKAQGLWRVRLCEEEEGHFREDFYIALMGKPTVFFPTDRKYWEDSL